MRVHLDVCVQGREESEIAQFTTVMRKIIHHLMATGRGTRDLCGSEGLTTEQFVDAVSSRLCCLSYPQLAKPPRLLIICFPVR